MAITLKTPPYNPGETVLTVTHTNETGTVIGPFALTESGSTGIYSHTRTIVQMPVGYYVSQLFDNAVYQATYATRVVADDTAVVVGATVDELRAWDEIANVTVLPFTGTTPDRTNGTTITVFIGEAASVSVALTGASLDALTLRFAVEDKARGDVAVIENADISRTGTTFTVTIPSTITAKVAQYKWSLRNVTASANLVLGQGVLQVAYAAAKDA